MKSKQLRIDAFLKVSQTKLDLEEKGKQMEEILFVKEIYVLKMLWQKKLFTVAIRIIREGLRNVVATINQH